MSGLCAEDEKLFLDAPDDLDLTPVYTLLWSPKRAFLGEEPPSSLEKLWKYHECKLCYQSMLQQKEYLMSYDKSSEDDQKELVYISRKLEENDVEFRTFEGKHRIYQEISAPPGLMSPRYIQIVRQLVGIQWNIYRREYSTVVSVNKKCPQLVEVLTTAYFGRIITREECGNEGILKQMDGLGPEWLTVFIYLGFFKDPGDDQ